MLKVTKLLTLFAFICLVGACNNDDEASPTAAANGLEGTWTAVEFSASTSTSSNINGQAFDSTSEIEGSNLDYDLVFTDDAFTTNGGYTIAISASSGGQVVTNTTDTYTDVNGNGTYTVQGDSMTITGSFFEFNVNGIPYDLGNGSQTAHFEINANGDLIFSQNETTTDNTNGILTTSNIVSTSRWQKQ